MGRRRYPICICRFQIPLRDLHGMMRTDGGLHVSKSLVGTCLLPGHPEVTLGQSEICQVFGEVSEIVNGGTESRGGTSKTQAFSFLVILFIYFLV